MTEGDYAALCAACDRLLRSPATSLERIAIPLLHVINEHPAGLRQYEPVLRPTEPESLRPALRRQSRALARVARAGLTRTRPLLLPATFAAPHPAATVLIVSHLTSPAQLHPTDDFYFGALQRLLQERGVRSFLVLVDHLRDEAARRDCRAQLLQGTRRLLPRRVSGAVEAQLWRHCLAAARHLRREAQACSSGLEGALAVLAGRQVMLGTTAANLRLHAAIRDLCRRLQPDIVITTHEGDACERMIWHAARATARPPLCVGYQHTRLTQHSHAIRRAVGPSPAGCDPDVILTLGENSHAMLAQSPQLHPVRLITYGSHRRAAIGQAVSGEYRARGCLVLPDADESECVMLFGFAADCARRDPDLEFVLRPHPATDFNSLQARHPTLRTLPANVTVSSARALEEDCRLARYCLYRGSSAALHAVLLGLKPFYVARTGELAFDPLFELREWRETVHSPQQFQDGVRRAEQTPDPSAAWRAWRYCDRAVATVRPEALDELLHHLPRR
jgi:hypothetical protein